MLRLRSEEEADRGEVVLSTPVSRTSWMAATTALALVAATKLTVIMGLGLGTLYFLKAPKTYESSVELLLTSNASFIASR